MIPEFPHGNLIPTISRVGHFVSTLPAVRVREEGEGKQMQVKSVVRRKKEEHEYEMKCLAPGPAPVLRVAELLQVRLRVHAPLVDRVPVGRTVEPAILIAIGGAPAAPPRRWRGGSGQGRGHSLLSSLSLWCSCSLILATERARTRTRMMRRKMTPPKVALRM